MKDTTELLLSESDWLHRLAAQLVADPGRAADAAQETLLAALRHPGRATRAWLGTVLRNAIRQERRSATRRSDREWLAHAGGAAPAALDTAARLDVQRKLIDAIEALAEPYRTTITLRYLEDLAVRDVAARLGVPVATVRSRIERGLSELRRQLDRTQGERAAWVALLAPWTRRAGPVAGSTPPSTPGAPVAPGAASTPSLGIGLLAMSTPIKIGALVALALVLGLGTWRLGSERPTVLAPAPIASAVDHERTSSPSRGSAGAPSDPQRRVLAATVPKSAQADLTRASGPGWPTFGGRVVDVAGRGVGGLDERFERTSFDPEPLPDEALVSTSAPDGRFELGLADVPGHVVATGEDHATIVSPGVAGPPPTPPVVVVGPVLALAGVVVDADGRKVAGAEVAARLSVELARRLAPGRTNVALEGGTTRTRDDGSFELPRIAFAPGARLVVDAPGFAPASLALPASSARDWTVELAPLDASVPTLRGVVLDERERPLRGAWVGAGGRAVATDADGAFVLELDAEPSDGTRVRAVAVGRRPTERALASLSLAERTDLVLRLDGEARSIRGRVVDEHGHAVPDALVWTPDGNAFGSVLEDGGAEAPTYVHHAVEDLLEPLGRQDRTDVDGRFRLGGLAERTYEVFALHPATYELASVLVRPDDARDPLLVLGAGERVARVVGHVVTSSGEPVAGAWLRPWRALPNRDGRRAEDLNAWATRTDAAGRFELERLAVEHTSLYALDSERGVARTVALADVPDLEDLTIVVPSPCHVVVHLADPTSADGFHVLDAAGERLALSYLSGSVTYGARSIPIVDGVSTRTRTIDDARFVVLTQDGAEVTRVAIRPEPDEVLELRL